jgi:hypothetical protein
VLGCEHNCKVYSAATIDLPRHPLNGEYDIPSLVSPLLKSRYNFEALDRASFAERYIENDLSVILDLGLKGDDLGVRIRRREKRDVESTDAPIFMLKFDAFDGRSCNHWDEDDMFIVNVQTVQGENVRVPSLVTFHAIQREVDKLSVYFSLHERGFKLFPSHIWANRKFRLRAVSGRTEVLESSAPDNIKSAMQIVNCIADNQCDVRAEFAVGKPVIESLIPCTEIHVHGRAVAVGRGAESLLDIRDVLLGPINF